MQQVSLFQFILQLKRSNHLNLVNREGRILEFPGEKLVLKLWETIAEKGIGSLLSPWQTKRQGRARNEVRREEMLMLAQAEIDAADVRSGRKKMQHDGTLLLTSNIGATELAIEGKIVEEVPPAIGLPDAIRVSETKASIENVRREINSTKAVLYAEEQLAEDSQEPPIQEIEDDWLFAWREHAGRVAAEDLQRLWGSVLAGEIKSPGRYSMRTLEFLKTLSKDEAELISKLARYSIEGRILRGQMTYLETQGVSFEILLKMQEMGVLTGVDAVGLNTTYKSMVEGKFLSALRSNGKALIVEHDDPMKNITLEVYIITSIGIQIIGLGVFEPDIEYLNLAGKQMVTQGFKVKLCDWRQLSETEGEYLNAISISA